MVIAATPNGNSTLHFINRTSSTIVETWNMPSGFGLPFPLVYDGLNRVLFVGARETIPPSGAGALLVLDVANKGALLYAAPVYLDADDLSVDMSTPTARRVFISAGNNTNPPTTGGNGHVTCMVPADMHHRYDVHTAHMQHTRTNTCMCMRHSHCKTGVSCFIQWSRAEYDALGTFDTGVYAKTSLLDTKSRRLFTAVPSSDSTTAHILVPHID